MSTFFIFTALLCMLGVVVVLMTGIVSMAKGGAFNEKYGNRLMQVRVALQGLAILFFILAFASSGQ